VKTSDRGSASLELVLLTPLLLVLLLLIVQGGRYAQARSDVDSAARDAARAGSLERSPAAAADAAEEAAERLLADRHVVCADLEVDLGDTDFRPGGTVEVTVSCAVDLSDLTGLGLPSSVTFDSTFSEPVDVYRGADS
jgi:Flp pilus assembly protein TadG